MNQYDISQEEYELFKDLIYKESGISLGEKKMSLVRARLSKRLRMLGLASFGDYYDYLHVPENHKEFFHLINAISTNVTSFFREESQWDYFDQYLKELNREGGMRKLRIWSSATSTGQEPYSIAMALNEFLPNFKIWDIKILATDIDTNVLKYAKEGFYTQREIGNMPKHFLRSYFTKTDTPDGVKYGIKNDIKSIILFRTFNLVHGRFEMFRNPMDIIFCRNVMIYFDGPTKDVLIRNFHRVLKPGGVLFIGHSESLTKHGALFEMIKPSIYRRR